MQDTLVDAAGAPGRRGPGRGDVRREGRLLRQRRRPAPVRRGGPAAARRLACPTSTCSPSCCGRPGGPVRSREVLAELAATVPAFAAADGGVVPAFGVLLGEAQPVGVGARRLASPTPGRTSLRQGGPPRRAGPKRGAEPDVSGRALPGQGMTPRSRAPAPDERLDSESQSRGGSQMTSWDVIGILIKIGLVVGITQGAVAYLILVERKVAAYAQDRLGPNRGVGPFRAAPAPGRRRQDDPQGRRDPRLRLEAALHPGAGDRDHRGDRSPSPSSRSGRSGRTAARFDGPIQFQIAPGVDVGILYVFAIGSLAVYGVILAGWASNNKYSFLGGLRSSAQLISYEIPLGMSILGMVLLAGSLDLNTIVNWQDRPRLGRSSSSRSASCSSWSAPSPRPTACRSTCPSREQELVGGFHTEYSAMKFGMFFLGEYLHVITVSYLTVILFFGGWDVPFLLRPGPDGLARRPGQGAGAARQGGADDPLHHVGPLDLAPVPLRPADGPGLEVDDPAGPDQPGGHRRDRAAGRRGPELGPSRPD